MLLCEVATKHELAKISSSQPIVNFRKLKLNEFYG